MTVAPVRELGPLLDRLEQLVDEPALADPRHADEGDELRLAAAAGALERSVRRESSRRRPTSAARASRSTFTRAVACTTSQTATGSAFPFASTRAWWSYSIASRVARYVCSPTRIPPVGAAACSRAAVLTTSPAASLGSAPRSIDQRLAGVDADPKLDPFLVCPVADRECRSHRTLWVVLVGDGRAEDRHHGVADELLHRAAEALQLRKQAGVVGGEHRPHVLGVELLRP